MEKMRYHRLLIITYDYSTNATPQGLGRWGSRYYE
jgi:hypothetical protein